MNVLQVSPRYAPRTGGVETQVQALSERLVDRGHNVTVLTADAGPDVERLETRAGVPVRRHASLSPGGAFHFSPGIFRSVRKQSAEVVHAHDVHSLPLLLAALGNSGAPFLATTYYHGASANKLRNLLWAGYRPLVGRVLRRAAAVTAVSDWERRQLAADYHVDAETIPIGIETSTFANAAPLKHGQPYLLMVCRLEEYKGVQHVIRALTELSGYDLLIAGDGPYRGELERLAKDYRVNNRIKFLGNVDHEKLPAYYAGAKVFLSLSRFESYGITVGEALASGTPCVVVEAGPLKEWSRFGGCVTLENTDPETIQSGVKIAEGTPVAAEEIPSWDSIVDRFEALYESL